MQAARGGESGFVGGRQDRGSGEQRFGILFGEKLQEAFGADTCPTGEQSLEVILAQPNVGGHFAQVRLAQGILFQVTDGLFDAGIIFGELTEIIHALIVRTFGRKSTRFLRNRDPGDSHLTFSSSESAVSPRLLLAWKVRLAAPGGQELLVLRSDPDKA